MILYAHRFGRFDAAELADFADVEYRRRRENAIVGIPYNPVSPSAARSGIGDAGATLAAAFCGVPWTPPVVTGDAPKPQWTFTLPDGTRVITKTRSKCTHRDLVVDDGDSALWDIVILVVPVVASVWTAFELRGWLPMDEYIAKRTRRERRTGWWVPDTQLWSMDTLPV